MARTRILIALLASALVTATCGGDTSPPSVEEAPRVVATTSVLGDLLAPFADAGAEIDVLMPNGADPHDWEPSSRDVAELRTADLVVAVGLGLEEGLSDVLAAAEDEGTPVLELAELADPLPFHDPRHADDDHGDLDPHVWLDPLRMQPGVEAVADALARLEPELPWDSASDGIIEELRTAHEDIERLVAPIPEERRLLVTNHDVLGYFAERYGFEIVGVLIPGGSTLGEASSRDLAELVDAIRAAGSPAIFTETTASSDLAERVAEEIGFPIEVVSLHTAALGPPGSGAEHYPEMVVENARLIADALGA